MTGDHLDQAVLTTAIAMEMRVVTASTEIVPMEPAQQDGKDFHAVKVCSKPSMNSILHTTFINDHPLCDLMYTGISEERYTCQQAEYLLTMNACFKLVKHLYLSKIHFFFFFFYFFYGFHNTNKDRNTFCYLSIQ